MRIFMAMLLIAGCADAQWRVMPMPASIRAGEGRMAIRSGFKILPADTTYSRRMQDRIERLTGIAGQGNGLRLTVRVTGSPEADESYRLQVSPREAVLSAASA